MFPNGNGNSHLYVVYMDAVLKGDLEKLMNLTKMLGKPIYSIQQSMLYMCMPAASILNVAQ